MLFYILSTTYLWDKKPWNKHFSILTAYLEGRLIPQHSKLKDFVWVSMKVSVFHVSFRTNALKITSHKEGIV